MKNLLLSTAILLSTATFASAAAHLMISNQIDNELATMSMEVDLSKLSEDEINLLYQATQTEDTNERKAAIESVLRGTGAEIKMMEPTMVMMSYPRNQLMRKVRANEVNLGIENVPLRSLSDDQLTQLYFLSEGSEAESDKKEMAQAIIRNQ